MMPYDEIEQAIVDVLSTLPMEAKQADWLWDRSQWTSEIKNRLIALAKTPPFNFCVCGSACEGAEFGEWLYDLTWYEENDNGLVRLPLVVESEWYPNGGYDGDFQKVLQA
jgi:hypothetical protein